MKPKVLVVGGGLAGQALAVDRERFSALMTGSGILVNYVMIASRAEKALEAIVL